MALTFYFIYISCAIQAYLCNRYEDKKKEHLLYPTDPVQRAKVDQMMRTTDAVEAAVRIYPVGVLKPNRAFLARRFSLRYALILYYYHLDI